MKSIFSSHFTMPKPIHTFDMTGKNKKSKTKKTPLFLRQKNLLIIEDDLELLAIYDLMRKERNWPIMLAKNSSEAISLLSHKIFDAIILDWNLPDFNGDALIKTSESLYDYLISKYDFPIDQKTPIITFSSDKDAQTPVQNSKYFYKYEHWDKPFQYEKVSNNIEKLIYSSINPVPSGDVYG